MPINPADFVKTIDNPLLPLKPGTTLVYLNADGSEVIRFAVTRETRTILGVECVVVLDQAFADGQLQERTLDYFAQDKDGNVWYFGEAVRNYVDGVFHDTDGSWLAGVANAEPGIIMKAAPVVGETYAQENAPGIAEDAATVLALDTTVSTPYADVGAALKTYEFTPLDPSLQEQKFYGEDIGFLKVVNLNTGETESLSHIEIDGTGRAETIAGSVGADVLRGLGGNDRLLGAAGNDTLIGGRGADRQHGGAGKDIFDINAAIESGVGAAKRDVIADFARGQDKIDLRTIDANREAAGNQNFHFIGNRPFHEEDGELRVTPTAKGVLVEGDADGDGHADFQVYVAGVHGIGAGDFLL